MFIVAIISGGLIVAAIAIILYRMMFDWRITAIQQESDQTIQFRRKVNYIKKVEQERHIRYVMRTCVIFGAVLLILIGFFLLTMKADHEMETTNLRLEERVQQLEKKQKQLAKSIPLKIYPEEGIGLKEYEWEKLVIDNKNPSLQADIEETLSQKLFQYVGTSDTALSLAIPKTMALHIEGQAEDDSSQETIKKNIDAFAEEAESIPELTKIQVRMVTAVGTSKKNVYSVNYSRETGDEAFNKQNVSEENLKNDGGKG